MRLVLLTAILLYLSACSFSAGVHITIAEKQGLRASIETEREPAPETVEAIGEGVGKGVGAAVKGKP